MTQEQIKQIRQMRREGVGYRVIGRTVGLTRDIVRNYCKSHNMGGYANKLARNVKAINHCQFCGEPLTQPATGRKRKFCSTRCRREWWADKGDLIDRRAYYEMQCAGCGKEFTAYGNKNRKYCSHECYVRSRFGEKTECQE